MKLNRTNIPNQLSINNRCSFKDLIRIEYSRKDKLIYIIPCGCCKPVRLIHPYAYDPEYFINNLMICLNNYIKAIDSSILSDNYFGMCTMVLESNCKDQLCKYKISGIKNIEISISKYCNYNCKKCSVHSNISDKYEENLYLRLIEKFKNINLDLFTFTCNGEPLLYKNEIFDFLRNSKSKKVRFITNASLLSTEDILEFNKYKDKLELWISIDSLNEEQYNRLTGTVNFSKVIKNLNLLKEYNLIGLINCVIYSEENQDLLKIANYFKGIPITFLKNAKELNSGTM